MSEEMHNELNQIQDSMNEMGSTIADHEAAAAAGMPSAPLPPLEVHVRPKENTRLQSFIRICFAVSLVCISSIAAYGYFKSIFERNNLTEELRCRNKTTIEVNEANSEALAIILNGLKAYGEGDIVGLQTALAEAPAAEQKMKDAIKAQREALTGCHREEEE